MPYLTVQEIETIAERIVRAYHRYCAQQNRKLTRIDPEIVTSNVLGLQIAYHKLSRFGHVLGLTCMLPVAIQVFDDVAHPVYAPLDGRTVFVDRFSVFCLNATDALFCKPVVCTSLSV